MAKIWESERKFWEHSQLCPFPFFSPLQHSTLHKFPEDVLHSSAFLWVPLLNPLSPASGNSCLPNKNCRRNQGLP